MRHDIKFITREDGSQAVIIDVPDGLGVDGALLSDWFDTLLWSLGKLRSHTWDEPGPDTVKQMYTAINDLENKLAPRLRGLRDALVRQHYRAGGSHGQLALALATERSTAQSRRNRIPDPPSHWETWARGELDQPTTSTDPTPNPEN